MGRWVQLSLRERTTTALVLARDILMDCFHSWPNAVVLRSKAWLRGCSTAGISGSNTAEGMNVRLVYRLCLRLSYGKEWGGPGRIWAVGSQKEFHYCNNYSRTPPFRINLYGGPSGLAEKPDNWIFNICGSVHRAFVVKITCFGWQFHPSSGVHVLYMATGKQTHLVSKFVRSKVVLSVWVVWSCR